MPHGHRYPEVFVLVKCFSNLIGGGAAERAECGRGGQAAWHGDSLRGSYTFGYTKYEESENICFVVFVQ